MLFVCATKFYVNMLPVQVLSIKVAYYVLKVSIQAVW